MIRSKFALALAVTTALTSLSVAARADEGFTAGSILVRARVVEVLPQVSNSDILTNGAGDFPSLAGTVGNGGNKVKIDNVTIPELDASYFFTPNLAVEAIAGTFRAGVKTNNTATPDLGNTWVLPPTITAQWHFLPTNAINPYLGAGLNYTFFYNTTGANSNNSTVGNMNHLNLSNNVGYALQAGVDVNIKGNWYANVDAKYIFLKTDATIGGGNSTVFPVTSHVTVNTLLIGAGVGYRF